MSARLRPPTPLAWAAPCDPQVQEAVSRQSDLFERAGAAQVLARQASEAAANAAAEHADTRARQLAEGGSDVGQFDSTSVDAAASSAQATADALASAATLARSRALEVALEREATWRTAALRRLDAERRQLLKALDVVESRSLEYASAWSEAALASSAEARDNRPKLARLVNPPALDDLRTWASVPPAEPLAAHSEGEAANV